MGLSNSASYNIIARHVRVTNKRDQNTETGNLFITGAVAHRKTILLNGKLKSLFSSNTAQDNYVSNIGVLAWFEILFALVSVLKQAGKSRK